MCSINGFIRFSQANNGAEVLELFRKIVLNSAKRGRDGAGFMQFKKDKVWNKKYTKGVTNAMISKLKGDMEVTLNVCRAEPLSERGSKSVTESDIQPFFARGICVAHNGVLSNDKEFLYPTNTEVDSAKLPFIIRELGENFTEGIKGSFALAYYDFAHSPDKLYLYRTYNPLTIVYDNILDTVFFTSEKQNIPEELLNSKYSKVVELPPYSFTTIADEGDSFFEIKLLPRKKNTPSSAILLCSGGLDSYVVAYEAALIYNKLVLMYFKYGCKAEVKELEAVARLQKELEKGGKKVTLEIINLDYLKSLGEGCSLIDNTLPISQDIKGVETPLEWVYNRNMTFISMAATYAEKFKSDAIYVGFNLEEGSVFCDNGLDFFNAMNAVMEVGTIARPKLEAPLIYSMKKDIIIRGNDLNVPLALSWSCYALGDLHCGKCASCFLRRKAFEVAEVGDLTTYES